MGRSGFGLPTCLLVICDGATGRLCWSKCRGNVASGPPLFLSIWWSLSDSARHRAGGKKGEAWTGQDDTNWEEGSSHPKPNLTHHPTLPLQHGSTIQSSTIVLRDCRTKDIYIYVRYYHQKERGTATLPRRKKNKKNKTVQKLYTKFSEFSTLFFPPSLSLSSF